MKNFRISFGVASCRSCNSRNSTIVGICKLVAEKLELYKKLNFDQVKLFNVEESEIFTVGNKEVLITTYKEVSDSEVRIIVQAFYPTYLYPNYFSVNGIGKMFADGLVFRNDKLTVYIPDSDLNYYR